MGNSLAKDVHSACKKHELIQLKRLLTSTPEGRSYDVFRILSTNEDDPSIRYDAIALFIFTLPRTKGCPSLPFLKFFKEHIDRIKSHNDNTSNDKDKIHLSEPQLQHASYAELLVIQNQSDFEGFRFLLDNVDTFPLSFPYNQYNCPRLLHQLCKHRGAIEHLREYLSSGAIDERFKNKNSCDNMKDAAGNTPLEVAVKYWNVDAVKELVVAKVGGVNFTDCILSLLMMRSAARKMPTGGLSNKIQEMDVAAACEIALTLLSQPGSEGIKDFVVNNSKETFTTDLRSLTPNMFSYDYKYNDYKYNDQNKLHKLLEIEFTGKEEDGDLSVYNNRVELRPSFATSFLWLGNSDDLYLTLVNNGCKQHPITKFASAGLNNACENGDTEVVKKILVEHKFHQNVIDVNRTSDPIPKPSSRRTTVVVRKTPLQKAAENNHLEIVKLLLDEGDAKIDHSVAAGDRSLHQDTALHLSCRHDDGEEVTKLLVDRGADLAVLTNYNNNSPTTQHYCALDLLVIHGSKSNGKHDSRIKFLALGEKRGEAVLLLSPHGSSLHLAVEHEYVEAVKILLPISFSAKNTKDNEGRLPKDLAEEKMKSSGTKESKEIFELFHQ